MGKRLDECIDARLQPIVERYKNAQEYSQDDLDDVTSALSEKWRLEIKQDILAECTEEEKQQIRYAVDKEREAYSAKKEVEDLRALIVEGILLAIIVGFTGQSSDGFYIIFERRKSLSGNGSYQYDISPFAVYLHINPLGIRY